MANVTFGNRRAGILCNLPTERRLDLIAEGLPVILASAESFWTAAASLTQAPREARVLEGFAEEEAAKILILMDLVRCPPKLVANLSGKIVRTFYDHLVRLIYGDAQSWRPVDVAQLRDYVDDKRRGHYPEGYAGEYIVPNWSRYSREAAMYADIEVLENGSAHWTKSGSNTSPWIFNYLTILNSYRRIDAVTKPLMKLERLYRYRMVAACRLYPMLAKGLDVLSRRTRQAEGNSPSRGNGCEGGSARCLRYF